MILLKCVLHISWESLSFKMIEIIYMFVINKVNLRDMWAHRQFDVVA